MDYSEEQVRTFIDFIDNEYLAEILVDNLPGVMSVRTSDGTTYYEHGFPVGGVLVQRDSNTPMGYALNNHLDFKIFYNDKETKDASVIVGFEITPRRYLFSLSSTLVFAIRVSARFLRPVSWKRVPP